MQCPAPEEMQQERVGVACLFPAETTGVNKTVTFCWSLVPDPPPGKKALTGAAAS